MKYTSFLLKPASSLCNMRCRYCFYEDVSDNRQVKSMGIMTRDTAEQIIRKAYEATDPGGSISFMFQGGEPTLAGIDFYREFLNCERQYGRPDVQVFHAIQTNGMTIDRNWAELFREHHFLVGISLDGTQAVHDRFRIDPRGNGSWDRIIQSLELLQSYQLDINLLCVVTRQTVEHTEAVWSTLSRLGNYPLQFIPCLDPLEAERGSCWYSLTPELYGQFLCRLFDCWYEDWRKGRYTSVRLFDDYLRILMGGAPSCCAASGSCGHYLVVEGDGSLYPCDFFVLDRWYMGNINDISVEEALASQGSMEFLKDGNVRPRECLACPYRGLCRGGCKRDWTEERRNYYCSSYKTFFSHGLSRLQQIARACR